MEPEKKQNEKSKKQDVPKVELDPRQKRKENLENLLKSRFFYTAAYEIYGGVKGLYDYGPPGCSVQANILQLWREWFILEDSMQQISTSALTPEVVFQTSGRSRRRVESED
jgi:glycyl-tRNA synthetase